MMKDKLTMDVTWLIEKWRGVQNIVQRNGIEKNDRKLWENITTNMNERKIKEMEVLEK